MRGWVTGLRQGENQNLKSIIGVSGKQPIFNPALLQTLRWAAIHYVAPLAVMLPKAGPPNLPQVGRMASPAEVAVPSEPVAGLLVEAIVAGRKPPATYVTGAGPWTEPMAALAAAAVSTGGGGVIVVPAADELAPTANAIEKVVPRRVVSATSAREAAVRTKAWSQAAANRGVIVVGTPEVALWPVAHLAFVAVIGDGRRALKSKQTPTLHVRDVLRRRAAVERAGFVAFGVVPGLESLAAGVDIAAQSGRRWPLVEVVDRNAEPPTGAPLSDAVRIAVAAAARRDQKTFVFVSRRGFSPATRCTKCGELRRCGNCGSNPGRGDRCERCSAATGACLECGGKSFVAVGAAVGGVVEDLRRVVGEAVGPAGSGAVVEVGSERDIPPPASRALVVIVDVDSLLLRPHYRAEEDTLRLIARAASTVQRGRGQRCIVQTRMPSHRVIGALRSGSPVETLDQMLEERAAEQLPPFGELLAVELRNADDQADGELRTTVGDRSAVFGPEEMGDRTRWLIQGPDLRDVKIRLRATVQRWRDRGVAVRVDADPIDL